MLTLINTVKCWASFPHTSPPLFSLMCSVMGCISVSLFTLKLLYWGRSGDSHPSYQHSGWGGRRIGHGDQPVYTVTISRKQPSKPYHVMCLQRISEVWAAVGYGIRKTLADSDSLTYEDERSQRLWGTIDLQSAHYSPRSPSFSLLGYLCYSAIVMGK